MKSKILVAYFSLTGTTANLASLISSLAQADLFEIKPAVQYNKEDLDWQNKESRTSKEHEDPSSRPEIVGKVDDFDKYNVIFLGFPIWWYSAPRIVQTFLDGYDFTGKRIIPFSTSLGSSIEKAETDLSTSCKTNANWINGKRFGTVDMDIISVKSWIDDLGI